MDNSLVSLQLYISCVFKKTYITFKMPFFKENISGINIGITIPKLI